MWWFSFFNGENKDRNKTNIAFGCDLAPHIEISPAWRPGMLSDFSPAAVNNDLPLHPYNLTSVKRRRKKERREKTSPSPSEESRLAQSPQHGWRYIGNQASEWSGQRCPWHLGHFSRSLRTRKKNRLIIFWGILRSHML